MSKIKSIKARKILDSRGNFTVEVDLITEQGVFRDSAPSGASKGKYEAPTVSPERAVKNINEIIAPKLKGKDVIDQQEIDRFLNPEKFGANATTPVSLAVCRAGASARNLPLYQYISLLYETRQCRKLQNPATLRLPMPAFNVINGGVHAGNELDFQEFMMVLQSKTIKESLQITSDIYQELRRELGKNVGDEGGFAPPVRVPEEALNLILAAAKNIGYQKKIKIILDVAASQFFINGKYKTNFGVFTVDELLRYYSDLVEKYPIIGLEDPFAEDDWEAWKIANCKLQIGNLLIIGDDLLVTNPKRIKMAKEKKACNGAIIKINQIGAVSEAIEAARLAKNYDWKIMVSHRSGETNDDFISDLAVGIGADFIKAGAPARGERVAKYNRLLKIEEDFTSSFSSSLP